MRISLLVSLCLLFQIAKAQTQEFNLDEKYPISKTGTLHLSSDDAKVTIQGSERDDVHVDISRRVTTKGFKWGEEDFTVEVEERNGNLYIRERNRSNYSGVIGYMREEYEIIIELPASVSLDIDGDDDDYRISDISGEISIDADDADLYLRNCTGNAFRFNIDDGDFEMDKGRGSLELDIDDGDAEIRNASFNYVDASMDDGDLVLETSVDDQGRYDIRSSDGTITFIVLSGGGIFDISHDDTSVRADNDFDLIDKSEHRTSFELPKGKARIKIRCDDSRVNLEIM